MSEIFFNPIQGTEELIQVQGYQEGNLYFSTDSGKIYLDTQDKRVPFGGGNGVSIYYGNIPEGLAPDPDYGDGSFYSIDMEYIYAMETKPSINDLILSDDGTFFKIMDITDNILHCKKVLVSGGGGGSGGVGLRSLRFTINSLPTKNLINGQDFDIVLTAYSAEEEENVPMDDTLSLYWELIEKQGSDYRNSYANGTATLAHGIKYTLPLGEFLKPSTTSMVKLKLTGINSPGVYEKGYPDFITSELEIKPNSSFTSNKFYTPDSTIMSCSVQGQMPKILEYYFDDELIFTDQLKIDVNGTRNFQIPANLCTYGAHKCRMELYQGIPQAGTDVYAKGEKTAPLEMEIAIITKDDRGKPPIIWFGHYEEEYLNYDDIQIPFAIFDPENVQGKTRVWMWKNGIKMEEEGREAKTDASYNIFEIANADMDMLNQYSISCGTGPRETIRHITFKVSQDTDPNRNMELQQESLQLLFDSKGRQNSESSTRRASWVNPIEKKPVKATFSNFNWYNNGWIPDEKTNNTCLRISNGASFTLPIGQTTFAGVTNAEQSWTFETQFKVRNVQNYSQLIQNITRYKYKNQDKDDSYFFEKFEEQLNTTGGYQNYDAFLHYFLPIFNLTAPEEDKIDYDDLDFNFVQKKINLDAVICGYYSGTSTEVVGFGIGPQDAFFSNGQNTVNVAFVEDKMVNLTMVYSHDSEKSRMRRLYIYINGILTGVITSTLEGSFKVTSENIVFNSKYCDIDLYKFRIYNRALTMTEVSKNYAVDTKDINAFELSSFLGRADNETHEDYLDFESLVKYNEKYPSRYTMPYIIFTSHDEEERLPWSKKAKIKVDVTFKNFALDYAYKTGELLDLVIKDPSYGITMNSSFEEKEAAVKEYYKHHCPSWTGTNSEISVQGTSSEFYPRRNYKLKTKGKDINGDESIRMFLNDGPFEEAYYENFDRPDTEEDPNPCHLDWFYMDNKDVGTTKFTFKIDYMESSGTYNMGLANLVANAYSKHPIHDYLKAEALEDPDKTLTPDSYRTSVQGYPVLAFHYKEKEKRYRYLGRYNMLIDKGSDECYGFKPAKSVLTKNVLDKKGMYSKLRDVAECWEYSDNRRTYCSFRDPYKRYELSFNPNKFGAGESNPQPDGKPGQPGNGYTSAGAPEVADSFEYRYHKEADNLDLIYSLNTLSESDFEELGVDNNDYAGACNKMYEWYGNWEKACQWVWKTCTDKDICDLFNIVDEGTFAPIELGTEVYVTNKFYVYDESLDTEYKYRISNDPFDKDTIYFAKIDEKTYVKAYVVEDEDHVYQKDKFYVEVDGIHLISNDDFDSAETYYIITLKTDEELEAEGCRKLPAVVTYGNKTHKFDTIQYRQEKFTNELKDHFDIEYLTTYFVVTEILEAYDSRGKNCMMASWGPQKEGGDYIWYPIFYDMDTQLGINNTGIPSFEYYVDATEENSFSTSDSVLWNNFFKNYRKSYILKKYRQLRGETEGIGGDFGTLKNPIFSSIDKIEGWYRADPKFNNSIVMRGQRPLIALNFDEQFKYLSIYNPYAQQYDPSLLAISRDGKYEQISTDYFYALQGDRSLSRQQFLTNRFEYIDSWLGVGNYQRGGANAIRGRIQANTGLGDNPRTSDAWVETVSNPYFLDAPFGQEGTKKSHEFDSEYWATLTPARNVYVTIGDDNEAYPSQRFTGTPLKMEASALKAGVRTSVPYNEQLFYIYGLNQMRDLGDLSKMYWTEFELGGDVSQLVSLKLGHDADMVDSEGKIVHDGTGLPIPWFNKNSNSYGIPAGKDQGKGMPLLKEVNLSNVSFKNESTFDFSSCQKLENFRATADIDSKVTSIKFAEGVALNTLYLPASLTSLELIEARLLKNIITDYEKPTNENGKLIAKPGLYIQNFTDRSIDDGKGNINISKLDIRHSGLGYDSYRLLDTYYQIRRKYSTSEASTKIAMTDVEWSPYIKLVEGDSYNELESELYFRDNGHYGFIPYEYDSSLFEADILNGELYKLDLELYEKNKDLITSLKMFETLAEENRFAGINGSIPEISGIIYINNENDENMNHDEYWVRNTLLSYYPNATFFFAKLPKSYSAKFVLPDLDEETGEYLKTYSYVPYQGTGFGPSVQKIRQGEEDKWFDNPYTLYRPEKKNYDFLAWSTRPSTNDQFFISNANKTPEQQEEDWQKAKQTLDSDNMDFTFYAIFEKHKFKIEFFASPDDTEPVESMTIPFGDILRYPMIRPYKDDSKLAFDKCYKFEGWTTTLTGTKPFEIDKYFATQDYKFYAIFKEVSVYENILDPKYLIADYTSDRKGWSIKLKVKELVGEEGYDLFGKITIPARLKQDGVDLPITEIAAGGSTTSSSDQTTLNGFQLVNKITHVFFAKEENGNSNLKKINDFAFAEIRGTSIIRYVELPDSLEEVGFQSFLYCTTLENYDFGYTSSKSKLTRIGAQAFQTNDVSRDTLMVSGKLDMLNANAFGAFNNTVNFIIGSKDFPLATENQDQASTLSTPFNLSPWATAPKSFTIYVKKGSHFDMPEAELRAALYGTQVATDISLNKIVV